MSNPLPGKKNLFSDNYRWIVCALLFLATTINYLDRQVIGLLKDTLSMDFKWTERDYSNIVMAFTSAYALGYLGFGRLIDRIGTKAGYAVSVTIWSFAAMGHALAQSTFGFGIARASLGLGEAGNFPASIKAVAEWFPKKERSLATGIFNAGTNAAPVIGPLLIAFIYRYFEWKQAFIFTGALGFLWLILWKIYFDSPAKKASPKELEYIQADGQDEHEKSPGYFQLIRYRQSWAFILGKFLTDPIWWFYLFWIPSYFNSTFGLDLTKSAIHVSTVYFAAGFGSVLGGYLPGWFMKRGWPAYKARKTSMFIYAMLVVPVVFVQFATGIWTTVALISLAAGAHQAWSANIFTTVSDMFPKKAISTVVGFGGMAGSVGGVLFPLIVGILLDHYKASGNITVGYNLLFFVCGAAYLVAWTVMHWLAPKMEKIPMA